MCFFLMVMRLKWIAFLYKDISWDARMQNILQTSNLLLSSHKLLPLITDSESNKYPLIAASTASYSAANPSASNLMSATDRSLTLPSCVCGRSVSTGSSRFCVWPEPGLAGRLPEILQSGLACRTERAQWSSSRSTLRRSTRCWLKTRNRAHVGVAAAMLNLL